MNKKSFPPFLLFLALAISLVATFSGLFFFPFIHAPARGFTAHATSGGTVTLTQAGSAGISVGDDMIAFGSGKYVSSCSLSYALLNSNASKSCWDNTTAFMSSEDVHTITNTGTSVLNLTVSPLLNDAEVLYCGSARGCESTDTGEILVQSNNSENSSCSGLSTGFEYLATNSSNRSVGVCDVLDFADASDSVKVYVQLHVPQDATPGDKVLTLSYEANTV